MKLKILSIFFLVLMTVLSACAPAGAQTPGPDDPVSSDETPMPSKTPLEGDVTYEENAIIEKVDLLIMESFPLQVSVHVEGQLRDGCTVVDETWAEKVDETTFEVHIRTARPADAMCTQALVPFEENIPLDVNGLLAGTYTVKVYDQSATFTFEQDNVLKE
jgi:inhibitor of cysteine peptidase